MASDDGRSDSWIEVDLGREFVPKLDKGILQEINTHDFLGAEDGREVALLEQGRCAICEGPLEGESIRVSSGRGTIAVTCSVICLDDGLILGYLDEQMEDVRQRVVLRRQGVRESEDKS